MLRQRASPETLLDRFREPIIIDEIQYAPTLLKHIKVRIDSDRRPGRFYLTGSQVFGLMEGVSESLAGFRSKEELFASSHAGAFWEAHVFSEIRKLFLNRGKRIPLYYWRTISGHEVDVIVEQSPLSMIAIEAKWKEQPDVSDAIGLRALESFSGGNSIKKIIAAHTHARYTLPDGTWIMGMNDIVSMLSE